MDVLTKEQRRRNMRAIKNKGSKEEVMLAKALWHLGYRYKKNDNSVIGKPDICFKGRKIAIFVDSEFFHGKDWDEEKYRIKSNREFWWTKIEGNMKRDALVDETLEKEGWIVLRFWSSYVRNNLASCVGAIESHIKKNDHVF